MENNGNENRNEDNAFDYQQNSYGPDYGTSGSEQETSEEEKVSAVSGADNEHEPETETEQGQPEEQTTAQENEPFYSYQNYNKSAVDEEPGGTSQIPGQMKPKKNSRVGLMIIGAVMFGLIAAVCFFGVNAVLDKVFPSESQQIKTVDPSKKSVGVTTVSGSSISQVSDVSGIVENVMPSIVSITQSYKKSGYSIFGQYYEDDATGSGSGFIVSQDNDELLIVTNNHVVQDAEKIQVTFIDDTTAEATVKGTDATADLAVITIKIDKLKASTKEKIKVANLGDSDKVKVGQMAIAIGNALGYGQSVTVGYISAKDREVTITDDATNQTNKMTLLQTDAAINPGNSGGALLDINGNVIGINSVKYASSEVEGMGYAIPMSKAVPIINELMKREVLSEDEKGYLGITGRSISEAVSESYGMPVGVYVVEVGNSGSAKAAGVKVGDIITKINDVEVKTIEEVKERVNSCRVGTEMKITVKRSNEGEYKEKVLTVKLKGSSTLDDLEKAEDTTKNDKSRGSADRYDENYNSDGDSDGNNDSSRDGSGSRTLPWGGSLY